MCARFTLTAKSPGGHGDPEARRGARARSLHREVDSGGRGVSLAAQPERRARGVRRAHEQRRVPTQTQLGARL